MQCYARNSTVCNNQDRETAKMSIDSWMDKEDVVHIYNRILLSHEKECDFAICSNMDGLGCHYAKFNKSDRESQILYDITYMWSLKSKKCNWWI